MSCAASPSTTSAAGADEIFVYTDGSASELRASTSRASRWSRPTTPFGPTSSASARRFSRRGSRRGRRTPPPLPERLAPRLRSDESSSATARSRPSDAIPAGLDFGRRPHGRGGLGAGRPDRHAFRQHPLPADVAARQALEGAWRARLRPSDRPPHAARPDRPLQRQAVPPHRPDYDRGSAHSADATARGSRDRGRDRPRASRGCTSATTTPSASRAGGRSGASGSSATRLPRT